MLVAAFVGHPILAPAPASAATGDYKKCTVGDRVVDKDGATGTVVSAESGGVYCHVDLGPADRTHMYIFWMLRRAGTPLVDPVEVARIVPGHYACYAGSPLHYVGIELTIVGALGYRDVQGASGRFAYDPATQNVRFLSGSLRGQYGKYLRRGNIGLASRPTTFWATVCDLQA